MFKSYFLFYLAIFAFTLSASELDKIKIKNECLFTNDRIVFNVLFNIKFTLPKEKNSKYLYQIDCNLNSKSCEGVSIDFTNSNISLFTLNRLDGAKITTQKGSFYSIEWGNLRIFQLDKTKNTVTYRESGAGIIDGKQSEGFAEEKCNKIFN